MMEGGKKEWREMGGRLFEWVGRQWWWREGLWVPITQCYEAPSVNAEPWVRSGAPLWRPESVRGLDSDQKGFHPAPQQPGP